MIRLNHFIQLLATTLLLISSNAQAESLLIFNDKESEMLSLSEDEWLRQIKQSSSSHGIAVDIQPYSDNIPPTKTGPIVSIVNPTATGQHFKAIIPVKLLVYLKSQVSPIDIDTLAVKGKRGIFSLDITDRLTPFMREPIGSENADYVIDGEIPKLRGGRYHVVLSLSDVQGNHEEQSIFLEVLKKE